MLYKQKKVSSGINFLDRILNGGYENDTLTTIYGLTGSGKSSVSKLLAKKLKLILSFLRQHLNLD